MPMTPSEIENLVQKIAQRMGCSMERAHEELIKMWTKISEELKITPDHVMRITMIAENLRAADPEGFAKFHITLRKIKENAARQGVTMEQWLKANTSPPKKKKTIN
jgi:sulfur relay (sulfurtransferase) DsrC/TusE family protein